MMKQYRLIPVMVLCFFMASCSAPAQQEPVSKTLDGPLDTVSTVTIYEESGERPIDEIFTALADIDKRMSAASEDSEISAIGAHVGQAVKVSPDTFALIAQAKAVSEASGGAFDPTIRPVVALWGIGTGRERVPSSSEISEALSLVNAEWITLDEENVTVRLDRPGMKLDLGAIAKGYACDVAVGILEAYQISHAIVDLGGNIFAVGTKPDGSPWRVGVKNPLIGETGYFGIVQVANRSAVTSGVYERFFEQDGRMYHHIMNPATGYPADNGLLSVTIVHASSAQADALSTACFVMGMERGLAFLAGIPEAEGIFVTDDRHVYTTPGLSESFAVTDDRFTWVNGQ